MAILARLRSRATMYSVATAALLGAFCVLLVADILLNSESMFGFLATLALAVASAVGVIICLVAGDRLGPWAALLLVFANALTIVFFFTVLRSPAGAIGVVVQMPVLSLYLGGFLSPWLARTSQSAVLFILVLGAVWDPYDVLEQLNNGRNALSVALFTWLCLEAGIFVQRRFKAETHVDALTGALNRRGLVVRADVERARAERTGQKLCIAVADLDGFKHVNDTHGHVEGDRVLSEVARQWRSLIRETDAIARIGGDEFIFVLPNTDVPGARRLLGRLRAVATHPWSWGVVEWDPKDMLAVAIAGADREMYRKKLAGSDARSALDEMTVEPPRA